MNQSNITSIASFFLVIMFFLSGITKITSYDTFVKNLTDKLYQLTSVNNLNTISHLGIILVILLEIIAPLVIIYYVISQNIQFKSYAVVATIGLIIFTILVTLMYHLPTFFNYYKSIPFLTHLALLGGLLLLLNKLQSN